MPVSQRHQPPTKAARAPAVSLVAAALLALVSSSPSLADTADFLTLRQRSQAAADALRATWPEARVRFSFDTPAVAQLTRVAIATEGASPEARARAFVDAHRDLLGIASSALVVLETHRSRRKVAVRFGQVHQGMRVFDRGLTVALNARGEVVSVINNTFPIERVRRGALDDVEARDIVQSRFGAEVRAALSRGVVIDRDGAVEVVRAVIGDPTTLKTRAVLIDTTTHQTRGLRSLEKN